MDLGDSDKDFETDFKGFSNAGTAPVFRFLVPVPPQPTYSFLIPGKVLSPVHTYQPPMWR